MNTEKVMVFIDGGNFYRKLKEPAIALPKGSRFDYIKFINFLVDGRNLVNKKYYIGAVRNHDNSAKSLALLKSQQKFLNELKNQGFEIEKGKIVYDHNIREKGVDVKIAIDLVIGAVEDSYDVAIIVSSDTDLIPAIRYVQSRGKKVEYVGFSHLPSIGMIKQSDIRRLLTAQDIQNCI